MSLHDMQRAQDAAPSDRISAIIDAASFFWERAGDGQFEPDDERRDEREVLHLLGRWRRLVGDGDSEALRRRLLQDGIECDPTTCLAAVRGRPDREAPDWGWTLGSIMASARDMAHCDRPDPALDPGEPIPYEHVLVPALAAARSMLSVRLSRREAGHGLGRPAAVAREAITSLERALLKRLAVLCEKALDHEFARHRPDGRELPAPADADATPGATARYDAFVAGLLSDGLLDLFLRYPVLARLTATLVDLWVDATAELLDRLERDMEAIQTHFARDASILPQDVGPRNGARGPGRVRAIEAGLSDPHRGGRSVMTITFEDGLRLVYKPKNLGLEAAFGSFLDWCNGRGGMLALKAVKVLDRGTHGWAEFVENEACTDEEAVGRFYERAGMLLCVLHVLRATDCHHENLIASGEHPVLIDAETLLHPEARPIGGPDADAMDDPASLDLWDSALRTGMLPRWEFSADRRVAFDVSGLGSTDPQQAPRTVLRRYGINTDAMHARRESAFMRVERNVPRIGDEPVSPDAHTERVVSGFSRMYRFLMAHREELLDPGGPLAGMRGRQVRFLFRATRIYGALLDLARSPDRLRDGACFSIHLDLLSRALMVAPERPAAWPILSAELKAMAQLDVPSFFAVSDRDELLIGDGPSLRGALVEPGLAQAEDRILNLAETDLARQAGIIRGAFHAKVARGPASANAAPGAPEAPASLEVPLPGRDALIEAAAAIAARLEAGAIPDPNGGASWVGLGYVIQADRFQLQVLDDGLYDGRSGIALFLAGLHRVTRETRFRDLALQAFRPLRRLIDGLDRESRRRMIRRIGIGGASGLGSMIYALTIAGDLLGDEGLLCDALALSGWITPELIAVDGELDVIGGAAGCILGLLPLSEATGDAVALDKAVACGRHLVARQEVLDGGLRAWRSPAGERPLAGFSHGAAGISCALARLHAATGDEAFREAALDGVAYERSLFSEPHGNWPDLRRPQDDGPPAYMNQWCHGAAGIALARLAGTSVLGADLVDREVEAAVETTRAAGMHALDHLCCGNMGRVETLLVAGRRLGRPDLRDAALRLAGAVVARAGGSGAYGLFHGLPRGVSSPGFFKGVAGIGFQLLRLADEDLPSVLSWERTASQPQAMQAQSSGDMAG